MRILHAEAREKYFGLSVGPVVVVAVGVKQQVRRLEHEHAAATEREPAARLRPVTKSLVRSIRPSPSRSSRIVMQSSPFRPPRRRFRDAVISRGGNFC